jgi:hypothetical protein
VTAAEICADDKRWSDRVHPDNPSKLFIGVRLEPSQHVALLAVTLLHADDVIVMTQARNITIPPMGEEDPNQPCDCGRAHLQLKFDPATSALIPA